MAETTATETLPKVSVMAREVQGLQVADVLQN